MQADSTPARLSRPVMLARRFGWGGNGLRRGCDRVESAVVVFAMIVGLLAIPIAAAIGTAVHKGAVAAAEERAATARPAVVRTVEAGPVAVTAVPMAVSVLVRAEGLDAWGTPREVVVKVPVGTPAGTEVEAWLDPSGQVVAPPSSQSRSAALGITAGVGTLLGVELVLLLVVLAVRWPLDRWRARAWGEEWRQVGPRWSDCTPT